MLVKNLLESKPRDVITTGPEVSIEDAMDLLIRKNIGCLPVINKAGELVGILSDKDIFKKCHETRGQYAALRVEDVMSTNLIVGLPDDDLSYIAGIMKKNWIRHVPIVDGDHIIGLVSQRDILKTTVKTTEVENRYMKMYLDGLHSRDRSSDY
ncbi:MAG: CBS domain-containing protein [Candidatus Zixiibacteriota bacterium]|nr:MAG: CBS domain-containing protein [candidate division Zixibacteria bacterium]